MLNPIKRYFSKLAVFDIDGVVLRGHKAINGVKEAFEKLNENKIPFIFLTNGCPTTEDNRIKDLEKMVNIKLPKDIMIMAQTPFRNLKSEHNKHMLLIGQGDMKKIIGKSGFNNTILLNDISKSFPNLDACDKYRKEEKSKNTIENIDGIIIIDDPLNYESSIQLIIDLILTNGNLNSKIYNIKYDKERLPVYVGNTDYLWVTQAPWPRIGNGVFLSSLELTFKKLTGKELEYKTVFGKPNISTYKYVEDFIKEKYLNIKDIFFIGDNILTDIYGANSYGNYLKKNNNQLNIHSILVESGVYSKDSNIDENYLINLLHRDTIKNPAFLKPTKITLDALDAVNYIISI